VGQIKAQVSYHTWDQGKGRRSCCYYMTWTNHLRDNYEFENRHKKGGLVYDDWMWELNKYGWAQHHKVEGSHTIDITWAKGYQLEHDDPKQVIKGRLKPFPQCQ